MPCVSIALCFALVSGEAASDNQQARSVAEHARILFLEAVAAQPSAAHSETRFKEAVQDLELFARLHSKAAGYYLALGNAALLGGDLPAAILAYRQGLHIAPGSRELRSNLQYARSLVSYSKDSSIGLPTPEGRVVFFTLGQLFLCSVIVYTLALIALVHGWRWRQKWLLGISLTTTLCAFLAVLTIGHAVWLQSQSSRHPLLVLSKDAVVLRRGNGVSYPPRFDAPLNRGVEASLLFRRGNWMQVELMGGQIGWIPSDAARLSELDLEKS
jgi:hypothetical protein